MKRRVGLVCGIAVLGCALAELAWDAPPSPPAPPSLPTPPAPTVVPRLVHQPDYRGPLAPPGMEAPRPVPPKPASPPPHRVKPRTTPHLVFKQEKAFAWDSLVKEATVKPGQISVHFNFSMTNMSQAPVTILEVRTSCGCTVAHLPHVPWTLAAKAHGQFGVDVDVRWKYGTLTKTVYVYTNVGFRILTLRISIPPGASMSMNNMQRARNLQIALADRQAVFRGTCARCHLTPAIGKTGKALYAAACAVCHDDVHRASMVPNLHTLNRPNQDSTFWRNWITEGNPHGLMPAWSKTYGGPLSKAQIESLVRYLTGPFRKEPVIHPVSMLPAGMPKQ